MLVVKVSLSDIEKVVFALGRGVPGTKMSRVEPAPSIGKAGISAARQLHEQSHCAYGDTSGRL